MQTIETAVEFNACSLITASQGFIVDDPGVATLRSGGSVALRTGVSVLPGGRLAIEIDPAL